MSEKPPGDITEAASSDGSPQDGDVAPPSNGHWGSPSLDHPWERAVVPSAALPPLPSPHLNSPTVNPASTASSPENFQLTTDMMGYGETACRFCFLSDGDDLISPCRCRGTQQFVHRSCLDEWRASRGWFAFTHCSTCHARFHLRAPGSVFRCFLLAGLPRSILRFTAGLGLFTSMQLLAGWCGQRGAHQSDYHCIRSLGRRSRLFCYSIGIWEVIFHAFFGLGVDFQGLLLQCLYVGAMFVLKRYVVPPVTDHVLQACLLCKAPLPISRPQEGLPHPPLPFVNSTVVFANIGVPHHPICPAAPINLPPAPSLAAPTLLDNIWSMACAAAACTAYFTAVALAVVLGIVLSAVTVYELVSAMIPKSKVLRSTLAKEFKVLHTSEEYHAPPLSVLQQHILSFLWLLT